ncbi:MAG: hypothetical protein WHS86_14450 [Desulfosoma sp.]
MKKPSFPRLLDKKERHDSAPASFVRPRVRLALSLGRRLIPAHSCLQAVRGAAEAFATGPGLCYERFRLE